MSHKRFVRRTGGTGAQQCAGVPTVGGSYKKALSSSLQKPDVCLTEACAAWPGRLHLALLRLGAAAGGRAAAHPHGVRAGGSRLEAGAPVTLIRHARHVGAVAACRGACARCSASMQEAQEAGVAWAPCIGVRPALGTQRCAGRCTSCGIVPIGVTTLQYRVMHIMRVLALRVCSRQPRFPRGLGWLRRPCVLPWVPASPDRPVASRQVYGEIEFECNHWSVFENAIDMAHIHYLHNDTFGNQARTRGSHLRTCKSAAVCDSWGAAGGVHGSRSVASCACAAGLPAWQQCWCSARCISCELNASQFQSAWAPAGTSSVEYAVFWPAWHKPRSAGDVKRQPGARRASRRSGA